MRLKFNFMNYRNKFLYVGLLLTLFSANIFSQKIPNGEIKLDAGKLQNGASVDLTGNWFYRPDYAIKSGEKIETSEPTKDDFIVGVPQFLNPIRWWLDDSEDFKKKRSGANEKTRFRYRQSRRRLV